MGVNKEASKRSEVPFSRREEGRELGEEKERKEDVLNGCGGAFEEDFENM
jgi:hypothetical protein